MTAIPSELIHAIREARHLVVLTGAGVSAESGIPTFRDAMDGLWAKYDPMQLATPEAFERDPQLVSRWYDQRRQVCATCKPNPGHVALAHLEEQMILRERQFTLLTQNVDRLHQDAGSRQVIELHGTLWIWRCTDCGDEREDRTIPFPEHPPRCEICNGSRRPAVVWFGEMLPNKAIEAAERAVASCDLFLSVGTSAVVYPAAGFIHTARANGAMTVEVNLEPTGVSGSVQFALHGPSGQILPALLPDARCQMLSALGSPLSALRPSIFVGIPFSCRNSVATGLLMGRSPDRSGIAGTLGQRIGHRDSGRRASRLCRACEEI